LSFELDAVEVRHGEARRALRAVSLSGRAGEQIAIIGPSGAGKTTLLRVLATSLRPTAGRVSVLGTDPWQVPASRLRRLRSAIGMVHQTPPLPPRQRVIDAIIAGRLGQWPAWKSLLSLLYPMDIAGPRDALARLDVAERLFDRCDRLSGGQLQRVAVARVLYQRPDLLLADEPVSALDPTLADRVARELQSESARRGISLVASLHAVDVALRWFPRVVGLRDGIILFDGPPAAVSDRMLHNLYAAESAGAERPASEPEAEVLTFRPSVRASRTV